MFAAVSTVLRIEEVPGNMVGMNEEQTDSKYVNKTELFKKCNAESSSFVHSRTARGRMRPAPHAGRAGMHWALASSLRKEHMF